MHPPRRLPLVLCVFIVSVSVGSVNVLHSTEAAEEEDYAAGGVTDDYRDSINLVMNETDRVLTKIRNQNEAHFSDINSTGISDELLTHATRGLAVEATHEMYEPPRIKIRSTSKPLVADPATFTEGFAKEEPAINVTSNSAVNVTEECPRDSLLPCVTKCCPFGQTLSSDKACRRSNVRFIPKFTILVNGFNDTNPMNETEKMDKYNLIIQNICPNNRYRLEDSDSMDEFHLLYNGSLWLPNTKPVHTIVPSDQYCMEVFSINDEEIMLPLICFVDDTIVTSSFHFIVYPIGLIVSVPFLLATFLVYNLIPELRDLHGKTLSCYVFCLMVAYILLATVQLGSDSFDDSVCIGVAFAIQFSFLACFFWLNVLCFDTWRNIFFHGGVLTYQLTKEKQRSYFMFYSIYAWSCTIIFIVVTMVMNFEPTIPSSYLKPTIGVKTCWFNTQWEAVPYFYGPVAVLLIINVILFIMTAVKLICDHHKKPAANRTPTQTIHLCLSLFFIMGINWLLELISWAAGGPPFIWYITDICNTLQGIFIFIVFVMDRRVRTLCKTVLFPRVRSCRSPCCDKTGVSTRGDANGTDLVVYNSGGVTTYVFPNEDQQIDSEKNKFG